MQDNIVSREFVERILGYPKSSFVELTPAEEEGGVDMTGHQVVPEGAIYLTWFYSSNRSKVYTDMRFLISASQMFDLTIGVRSIGREGLVKAPNLMARPTHSNIGDFVVKKGPKP